MQEAIEVHGAMNFSSI